MSKRINRIAGLLSLAALYLIAPVAQVKANDKIISDDNNSYTVTIPSEVTLDSATGNSQMEITASLDAYSTLDITVASANNYNLCTNNNRQLEYELTGNDFSGKKITYTNDGSSNGDERKFSTILTAQVTGTPPVCGTYQDTLTFTIDCKNSRPTNSYKLILKPNDGTNNITNRILQENTVYGELPTPTRTGYRFEGWYTDPINGTEVTSTTLMEAKNTTIYAHWHPYTCTIAYNNNSETDQTASGAMDSSVINYGSTDTLRANTFENSDSGAQFNGWNTAPDGTGTSYTDQQEISNMNEEDSTITLYAQWVYKNVVEVRFEDVDGNMNATTETVVSEVLPAGRSISWSIEQLSDRTQNRTQWEKQWQTPVNNGAVNYTTEHTSKTTTIDIKRQMYYLDLNAQWYDSNGAAVSPGSGNLKWNGITTATVEVKINGKNVAIQNEGTDYFVQHRYGSTFEFIVTMKPGYKLNGIYVGKEQPLCNAKLNGSSVTGIVTGERNIKNSTGEKSEYDATTVALMIQKESSESTTTDTENQTMDENTMNPDSQNSIQDDVQEESQDSQQELSASEETPANAEMVNDEAQNSTDGKTAENSDLAATSQGESTLSEQETEVASEPETETQMQTEAQPEVEPSTEPAPESITEEATAE